MKNLSPIPCAACGGPKLKRRGSQFCDACRAESKRAAEKRASQKKGAKMLSDRRARGIPPIRSKRNDPEGHRWCARCREVLPEANFPPRKGKPASYCTPCSVSYHRTITLRTKYGIGLDEYEAMLAQQDGRCAICLCKPRKQTLAVDHDHDTGQIRGLLCVRCNHRTLGGSRENPSILRRAADYLEAPPAQTKRAPAEMGEWYPVWIAQAIEEAREEAPDRPVFVVVEGVGEDVGEWFAVTDVATMARLLADERREGAA